MRRTPWVLVAVISAAAVLSGCGRVGDPAAAKVGSATISRVTLDDQLSELTGNSRWMQSLRQSWGTPLAAPKGGVNTQLSAAWLSSLMNQAIVDQAFRSRHLKVTAADRTEAKKAALGIFAGTKTFEQFPSWFRADALRRQERYAAVAATVPPRPPPTETQLRDYFTRIGPTLCPSNVAILELKVGTQAEADAILAELAQGADFPTLAKQRSTESQSAPNGGLAACKDTQQYGSLPASVRQAVGTLAPGSVSAVVPLNSAFYVFKVEPWTFELSHSLITDLYKRDLVSPVDEFISVRLSKSKIWIDPRYGKVKRNGARVVIEPPVAPTPQNDPPFSPSTTAPAGATGQ